MLELLVSDFRLVAQNVFAFSIILAAFVWGKGPERAVAATWLICFELADWINSDLLQNSRQLLQVDMFWASADTIACLSWVVIALYANRNYTLWIAGLQILVVSAHLARGLAETVSPLGYTIMIAAPGWFQLSLLAIGLLRHLKREKKFGPYREWRTSRPPIDVSGGQLEQVFLKGKPSLEKPPK